MSFLTMMGMMFPQVLSNLPQAAPPLNGAPPDTHRRKKTKGRKGRCRDYDTKGYCALGSACPYEHGGEVVMSNTADGTYTSPSRGFFPFPQIDNRLSNTPTPNSTNRVLEYDPTRSSLAVEDRSSNSRNPTEKRGRARPPGRTRAPFSQAGPTSDRSNTTIVVEQIPEEHFSEEAVRRFFSQFGNILEVDMQAYKRLAIVKYDDHFAARRAYDSPKVIFDNRFVKVYWYNPDTVPEPPVKDMSETHQQDEEMLDPEEVERRQAEAQKAYEERQKKAQEADARAEEVERKLREREEEMRILREKLAKKGGSKESAALIDQLSSLQAEAQDLNGFEYPEYAPRGRGRGGYRGRGFYAPRGRGYSSYRGGYSGRGFAGAPFAGARTGVKRLDNRPKRIAVSGVEPGSQLDETLREHLLVSVYRH
jgi:RNA recognition motif-containing protein